MNDSDLERSRTDSLGYLLNANVAQAHHHENQRVQMANFFITISVGIVGYAFQQKLSLSIAPLTIFLFIIGLVGALFSLKFSQRFHLYYTRYKAIENHIINDIDGLELAINKNEKKNIEKFGLFDNAGIERFEIYQIWFFLFSVLSVIGLILTFVSIYINWSEIVSLCQ